MGLYSQAWTLNGKHKLLYLLTNEEEEYIEISSLPIGEPVIVSHSSVINDIARMSECIKCINEYTFRYYSPNISRLYSLLYHSSDITAIETEDTLLFDYSGYFLDFLDDPDEYAIGIDKSGKRIRLHFPVDPIPTKKNPDM